MSVYFVVDSISDLREFVNSSIHLFVLVQCDEHILLTTKSVFQIYIGTN